MMRVREITISDVRQGKSWRVIGDRPEDMLDREIREVSTVDAIDTIVHSSVMVSADRIVYPCLVIKYYESGGEDMAIYVDGIWCQAGAHRPLCTPLKGPYIAVVSKMDHHEYQKGKLDNRREHRNRFLHYAAQIGQAIVVPFEEAAGRTWRLMDGETYVHVATAHGEAVGSGNTRVANKNAELLQAAYRGFQRNPEVAIPLLRDVMRSESEYAQVWAAAHSLALGIEIECAMRTLERIASGSHMGARGLNEMAAGMILDQWKKGELRY
jgi:hypothetical protein